MAETESMPESFIDEYKDAMRQEYIQAKEAYNIDKQSKIKTLPHE
jgi:hypothetical protein